MYPPAGQPWLHLDSTLEGVDQGESLVKAFLQQSALPSEDQYWVLLAVRELLVNAAYHGNKYDPQKKVGLRIAASNNLLSIDISDEGDGFDPDAVPDPKLNHNLEKQSGRGLLIARSFLDEVIIERNQPRGMLVHMTKKIHPEP